MKNLPLLAAVSSTLCCLLLPPSIATATPAAGTNELRIDGSYIIPGYSITGYNRLSAGSSSSSSLTLFGVGFAYGRFLTDNLELGATLSLYYVGSSSNSSSGTTVPGIAPFVRGFLMVADRFAVFGSATAGIQYAYPSSGPNQTELMVGGDLGAEFFLADSWSLRVGPTYRHLRESETVNNRSVSNSAEAFGVNWAIAGYF